MKKIFLFVKNGGNEALAQTRVTRHAVERDLDRDAVVIVRCLVDEAQEGTHRLIRIGEQDVVVLDLAAHGLAVAHHGGGLRSKGRERERALAACGNLALELVDEREV